MRNFQKLNQIAFDEATGVLSITVQEDNREYSHLTMRREGVYVAISASYGPIEIALRPRHETLMRKIGRLQPIQGLKTTRQIGTTEAYLGVGLNEDGSLLIRPTIVADASGHLSFNLILSPEVTKEFYTWLGVPKENTADDNT